MVPPAIVHSRNKVSPEQVSSDAGANARARPDRLVFADYAILSLFCLILFGYYMFRGRPLSLHKARVPQTAREMLAGHNWLFPQSGGRPWLERPPLPHWMLIGASVIFGQKCDSEWIVRLPSVLMGTSVVLMTAWMASVWFGRTIGLLSGLALSTMFEFYTYSILAEDDIFLAAFVTLAVALFVSMEFASGRQDEGRWRFLGNRPWRVWAFFIILGLSNIVKSPLLGPAVVVAPIGGFLFSNRQWPRLGRYLWGPGWMIFAILLVAWTLGAIHAYPDVTRNWAFDYKETAQYDEPVWYYPPALFGFCLPWILAAIPGLIVTFNEAWKQRGSPERFLWCWAILPIVVLSIHHRKHHHYLVPSLAPWGILAAIGITVIWHDVTKPAARRVRPVFALLSSAAILAIALLIFRHKIPIGLGALIGLCIALLGCIHVLFLGIWRRNGTMAAAACFLGLAIAYCWGQTFTPDMVAEDTLFLRRVDAAVPRDQPLFVNSDLHGEMDFFRNQFYLRPSAILLHNLTFLREDRITSPQAWIVTPYRDREKLQTLGEVTVADQSRQTRREKSAADRFTLFRLRFRPDLQRYPRPPYVNTLQAMDREKGPYCGPPL